MISALIQDPTPMHDPSPQDHRRPLTEELAAQRMRELGATEQSVLFAVLICNGCQATVSLKDAVPEGWTMTAAPGPGVCDLCPDCDPGDIS